MKVKKQKKKKKNVNLKKKNYKKKKRNLKKRKKIVQKKPVSSNITSKLVCNASEQENKSDNKKQIKLKKQYRIILFIFLLCIFIGIFSISVAQIALWYLDNQKIKTIENEIIEDVPIVEVTLSEEEVTESLINVPKKETDIYWKYKDVSLIDVDINELKKENNDTIGWIQVLGTNINYPIVQYSDNNYYLNHDYKKRANGGGWIFLDYRNNLDNLASNNIIYGHRRYNESMFGTLKNVLTNSWLKNTDYHIIKISTLNYNYLFQVFSVYSVPNENYYLQTEFRNDEEFNSFLNTIVSRSVYDFQTEVNSETKILTLSTCHSDNDRLVVHSKLIKATKK